MKRSTMAVALLATLVMTGNAQAQTVVTWVNGTGNWFDSGWDAGAGAQSPLDVFGEVSNGWRSGNGPDPVQIVVPAGADLRYDGTLLGDLRMQQNDTAAGNSEFLLEGRFVVTTTPDTDINGIWTQWDMNQLTVSGAGAHFERINEQPLGNGGSLNFGSWRSFQDQEILIDVVNGGTLSNQGQITFGAFGDEADGLAVHMTIGADASVINTGAKENGVDVDDSPGTDNQGEINFVYSWDSDLGRTTEHDYAVNFTGVGGSLTVGEEGLRVQTETEDNVWDSVLTSYEDLWSMGIVQANGGNPGAFSDWFSVENNVGEADYKLTLTALPDVVLAGDYDGDGFVGQADLDLVLLNWGDTAPPAPAGWENEVPVGLIGQEALDGVLLSWGNGTAPGIAAVPEPTCVTMLCLGAALMTLGRRRS